MLMLKAVIMATGNMGSGKTTIINTLCRKFEFDNEYAVQKLKFARPLYEVHKIMFGHTDNDKKDRVFLQRFSDFMKEHTGNENIFANMLVDNLKVYERVATDYIIFVDDLRFYNEAATVKEYIESLNKDGRSVLLEFIKAYASEEVRKNRIGATFKNTAHKSELEVNKLDEFITIPVDNNYDDLPMLSKRISYIYEDIKRKLDNIKENEAEICKTK